MRLKLWYRNLQPVQQLGAMLLINWIIWLTSSFCKDIIFDEAKHTLAYHVFNATWMALLLTPLFNWKKVRAIFKSKSNNAENYAGK